MNNFIFQNDTKVYFGKGCVKEYLAGLTKGAGTVLLAYGGGSIKQKLYSLFGIEKLMVAGGGVMNWSFLAQGCIDELSLVIAPVADGSTTAVSIFEQSEFSPYSSPIPLCLKQMKLLDENVLWLRYQKE